MKSWLTLFFFAAPAVLFAQQSEMKCAMERQLVRVIGQGRALAEADVARLIVELEKLRSKVKQIEAEKKEIEVGKKQIEVGKKKLEVGKKKLEVEVGESG